MLSVIMLSVVMLNIVMLSVAAASVVLSWSEKNLPRTNTLAYFRQSVGGAKKKKCHGTETRVQTEPFSQRIKQRFVGSDDG
jgi:hypothetical protein